MLRAMAAPDKPLSQMSGRELWDSMPPFELDADGIARTPEFLGEYSVEEAEQLGTFFDDPAELEAFERALADEQARKAASN